MGDLLKRMSDAEPTTVMGKCLKMNGEVFVQLAASTQSHVTQTERFADSCETTFAKIVDDTQKSVEKYDSARRFSNFIFKISSQNVSHPQRVCSSAKNPLQGFFSHFRNESLSPVKFMPLKGRGIHFLKFKFKCGNYFNFLGSWHIWMCESYCLGGVCFCRRVLCQAQAGETKPERLAMIQQELETIQHKYSQVENGSSLLF